jgi:hypothetical protein
LVSKNWPLVHHLPRCSSAWELVSTIWLIKLGGFRFLKRWSPFVETYGCPVFCDMLLLVEALFRTLKQLHSKNSEHP